MKTKHIRLRNSSNYLPKMLNNEIAIELIEEKLEDVEKKIGGISSLNKANQKNYIWKSPDEHESIFLDLRAYSDNGKLILSIVSDIVEGGCQPFYLSFTFNDYELQHQIYVPIQYLLKSWEPKNNYSLYSHIIDEKPYYGITKRHWLDDRWAEHVYDARNGKKRLIWEAMQSSKSKMDVHVLMGTGYTKDEAMHLEEFWVDQWGLYPQGLNLIPGGYAGHRFLVENNLIGRNFNESDIIHIREQSEIRSQSAAALWLSDEYVEKVICSGEKRLSVNQVKSIRALFKEGLDAKYIAKNIDAVNLQQVQRVIDRKTYTRIK